jgi:hypothetical protein
MSQPLSPWCLHWGSDGELDRSDREVLLRSLVLEDEWMACLIVPQTMNWSKQLCSLAMPEQVFYQS